MTKVRIEFCLISARGLRRTSLWKLQWFAVGWVDPKSKYCTKIDASGSSNPTWRTKFSTLVDDSEPNLQNMALQVEVYSREPIFLREKLEGTATVLLKEFLAKYVNSKSSKSALEEVGSFQLRKKSSGKPLGFVDVSIRISDDSDRDEESSYYPGNEERLSLAGQSNGMSLAVGNESSQALPPPHNQAPNYPQMNPQYPNPPPFPPDSNPPPFPGNYYTPSVNGPSYRPPRTPPPPPPPSHVGYLPTFLPRNDHMPGGTYMNMPSSGAGPGRTGGPGFGVGMGAGALAAGAILFGDDFMSGFELPSSLTISTDPPF